MWLNQAFEPTVAFWQSEVPLSIVLAHGEETLQLFPILTVKTGL